MKAADRKIAGPSLTDVMMDFRASDERVQTLKAVLPMSTNLLHVLVRKEGYVTKAESSILNYLTGATKTVEVTRFSQLKKLPVGVVGSAKLLGRELNRKIEYGMTFVDFERDDDAIAALKANQVAAVFTMSGWPSGVVKALARERDITLIPYDVEGKSQRVVQKSYPDIAVYKNRFLSFPSLLVTRDFAANGSRVREVATLKACILSELPALRDGAYDPVFGEIDPNQSYGWPKFVGPHDERVEAANSR